MPQPATPASEPKLCFILGILARCGTNYIYTLLREHPDCAGPGPIWEDYFVHHSALLGAYARSVYESWNPIWEVSTRIAPQGALMRFLGDAIARFLRLQVAGDAAGEPNPPETPRGFSDENAPRILLTKTPSVVGAELFFDLFPDSSLIVMIRDGRAVVESGVRSFDWNYEDAMRRWRAAAHAVLALQEQYRDSHERFLVVRYEDLFQHEERELLRIFALLGLDPGRFDFARARSLGVTGSSETRRQGGAVHWDATAKDEDFNPLVRFHDWDRKKHDRFNWIAGRQMSLLGYDLEATSTNRIVYVLRNRLLDAQWTLRRIWRAWARAVRGVPHGAEGRPRLIAWSAALHGGGGGSDGPVEALSGARARLAARRPAG